MKKQINLQNQLSIILTQQIKCTTSISFQNKSFKLLKLLYKH